MRERGEDLGDEGAGRQATFGWGGSRLAHKGVLGAARRADEVDDWVEVQVLDARASHPREHQPRLQLGQRRGHVPGRQLADRHRELPVAPLRLPHDTNRAAQQSGTHRDISNTQLATGAVLV